MRTKTKIILLLIILGILILGGLNFNYLKSILSKGQKTYTGDFNILLITLDTTRADKIGYYGCKEATTPNIDSLASQGAVFLNAYSPVPLTLPAHCSIFTGLYPNTHKVRNNGSYHMSEKITTLTEELKKQNYTTAAFVSSFTVDSRFGLDQGFDVYDQDIVQNRRIKAYNSERPAESVFDSFKNWFSGNYNKKFFSWVHFFDPHDPYEPPEPFKTKFKDDPYLGELAYCDFYIGRIIDLLASSEILSKTLIIIAGDHGEAFGEHGEFGHQIFCYQENLKIPLIIYAPEIIKQAGMINSAVSLVDLAPTILDLLKLPINRDIQGISLLPLISEEKTLTRDLYFESFYSSEAFGCTPPSGIITGEYKYIKLPKEELYQLDNDPEEKTNLAALKPDLVKRFKGKLVNFALEAKKNDFSSDRQVGEQEKKKLASLGYISGSRQIQGSSESLDPKDMIKGYNLFVQGIASLAKKDLNGAEKYFKLAIDTTPKFILPYDELARIYEYKKMPDKAISLFEQGIKLRPEDFDLKLDFANLLLRFKKWDRSLDILKSLETSGRRDKYSQVQLHLADIYYSKGDLRTSVEHYLKILQMEPQNLVILKRLAYIFHNTGNLKQALSLYLKIEQMSPQDTQLMHDMAILYSQTKEYQKADIYYLKALKNPVNNSVFYNYALLLARLNKYRDACTQIRRFLEVYNKNDEKSIQARKLLEQWQSR